MFNSSSTVGRALKLILVSNVQGGLTWQRILTYRIFIEYSAHFFYIENDVEIFPLHYTWKVAEKGFKMAFMMNKPAVINSCEIILEKSK